MGSHGLFTVSPDINLHYGYAAMIVLAAVITFSFRVTKDIHRAEDRNSYYQLQAIALLGAFLGAKIAVVMGDALWPIRPFHEWSKLVWSGRSIVGALLFGFFAAESAKPLIKYKVQPNDRFAIILPVAIGIGRVGCYLRGCCRGTHYDGPFAIVDSEGVTRHPSQIYELIFHMFIAFILWRLYRSQRFKGKLFYLYLTSYGAFRFVSEFLRDTPKAFWGYSAYQWLALGLMVAGTASLFRHRHSRIQPMILDEARS